ncbi:GtrA family protein [Ethanoligenens harbinense]|uniref:GtrA family protein n=1 Tax=Ethanoligenens harbinense (strain DSM 18485 / JCM 12961 / CGMCC 1.5033 / YUAN-3) TaxID=663278 RepID=E6U7A9_ETHHY|nr:GtrA family protein [Ethanoligenens harbinense]ADU25844.1 GtrA family protein [Ethanoligenens harbinense YUAN-3]AVQ95005.1 GtrA family protein [Ethanoligenens harbinense YUAN-3]AYF37697.1 GtrA family protein [Ethanoligenens harbinense]AYF40417.1 GtrA family protein [Ethanoligenens harbinense]QCN91252.1 GtrA family protein [Ethanoligenens harbinense]
MASFKKIVSAFRKRYPTLYQLAGFCAVGASGLLVMMAAYYLFLAFHADKQVANLAGFSASTAYAYLMNFVFVFQAKTVPPKRAAVKFFALYIALYFFSAYMVHVFTDLLHISVLLIPILNSILITPPSFLGSKYWVFREKEKSLGA